MQLDDLLFRYFGDRELEAVPPAVLAAGIERMQVDLALAPDPAQKFALWCLLYMLGGAPDLQDAFKDSADRAAARNFTDLIASKS